MDNIKKVQNYLEKKRLSGLWITNLENILWLTGIKTDSGVILIQKNGRSLCCIDRRYKEIAEEKCKNISCDFFLYDRTFKEGITKEFSGSCYGIEDSLTIGRFETLKKAFPSIKWKQTSGIIEKLRRSKTVEEIQKIQKAQSHIDEIFKSFFQKNLRVGVTEKELAYRLKLEIECGGMYELAFDSIFAFGENSACPHHQCTNRPLQKNENVLIDCGAKFEGYCSDMTRNYWFGETIDPTYQEKYEILLDAQEIALKALRYKAKTKKIDKECRDALGKENSFFPYSLGHGVGLEVHEAPSLSSKTPDEILENEIITIEPGLHYDGKFGIRIEDLVLVRKDGIKILSNTPKDLILIESGL